MNAISRAGTVLLLVLLLTWLSWHAINPHAERFDRSHAALDHFAMVENALYRDVLSARTGLLRNYDPLVRDVKSLNSSLDQLRDAGAAADAVIAATINQMASQVRLQDELVEKFKTDNALLQNSLAYFGLFSVNLSTSNQDGPLVDAVSGLGAAMLHLTLDTSPEAESQVETRLDALAKQDPTPGKSDSIKALLAHGRLLSKLLPETDGVLQALFAVPSKQEEYALRAMILVHQKASREASRIFRILVYVASIGLLGSLIYIGLELFAGRRALERRASLEHLIAGISTRFINSKPGEINAQVEQALHQLAERLGTVRAYFVLAGAPPQAHIWCADGVPCPEGWPENALRLSTRLQQSQERIIQILDVDRLAPGGDKDALAAAGVVRWACVLRTGRDGVNAILGFDALRAGNVCQCDELGLMRMALDAIANAVGRESLEREKERLEKHLVRARRMETVGALTSGIAHNFNNIVGAILGYTEMAEARLTSDARLARHLGEIRLAGERARDLVDQILTFGRRRSERRSPVSVNELLAEAGSLFNASASSGIELRVHEASRLAIVSGDHTQLQQVVLNLCNNAAQAMDGKGRIEIETSLNEIHQTRMLSHGNLTPGRYVSIAVSDAGRGIEDSILRHIFEPFFTTRAVGNGLGLATAREIVREHGGAMNIRTQPGAGTCVEAWLPCIAVAISLPSADLPALPFGNGETVLVLNEDHEGLLKDEEIIAALGYEPVGFTRPSDVLSAWRETPQRFDALMVIHLRTAAPLLELVAIVRAMAPNAPILLATRSADEIGAEALVEAGVSEVVRLPFVATEIAAVLKRCLSNASEVSTRASAPRRNSIA